MVTALGRQSGTAAATEEAAAAEAEAESTT
jgi:hypothetical protein